MRRILPWLLMLLLALRGLTGTAMAHEGLAPALPVAQPTPAASAAPHHTLHGMDAHQGAATSTAAAAPGCDGAAGAGCASHGSSPACQACDICHSALPAPPVLAALPRPAHSAARPGAATPFASAQAAPALKPPIG